MKTSHAIATSILLLLFIIGVIAILHPVKEATQVEVPHLQIYDAVTGRCLTTESGEN